MKDKVAFIFTGQGEDLGLPSTQVTTFWQSLSLAKILIANGIKPDVVAGLSLGEYTALVVAGVLPIDETAAILKFREKLMTEALINVDTGMLACIGLDKDTVQGIAAKTNACITNFNSPKQLVVGGSKQELARFEAEAVAAGARIVALPVSGAFHSHYLTEASREFEKYLNAATLRSSNIPIYLNINGEPTNIITADILAKQMYSPVCFTQAIVNMLRDDVKQFYSIGIGTAPVSLIRDTAINVGAKVKIRKIENLDDIRKVIK